ncbi:MAG: metallophosphoesterase [Candidatus Helarchaeota archaeon]|nr:metallophosphoesterase [Candidatus Helarchaeota archaeon]
MVEKEDIINMCKKVNKILDNEPSLLRLDDNYRTILVVGDTHGDYDITNEIVQKFKTENYDCLIFLGDYVDRGAKAIQNINFVLNLKIMEPKKILLLRGNHEFPSMNINYGFYHQVLAYFKEDSEEVYENYKLTFSKLPYAIIYNNILMLHGGIPVKGDSESYTLQDIANIPKNIQTLDELPDIGQQIVWNDPKETIQRDEFSYRGIGYFFGLKSFNKFMNKNNLEYLIRSHEAFLGGHKLFFNGRLISLFTCEYYRRGTKIAEIIDDKINLIDI